MEGKPIRLKISRREAESLDFLNNINIDFEETKSNTFNFVVVDAIVFQNSAGINYSILTPKNSYYTSYE